LITDDHMPGRSGSELLALVARHAPSTVRVLLTGCPTLQPAERAINAVQVFRALRKPFSIGRLVTVIEEALGARRADVSRCAGRPAAGPAGSATF
jgi:DNA-binding NtrC family response regulator